MASGTKAVNIAKFLPWVLIICGIIGLIASFIIMNDKIKLLEDPSYSPSCSLNPVISCGSVMQSEQATAFGFPNPFIGLVAFPILIAVGAALKAGARFKRWFWLGLNAGTVFGVGFAHWLFFQSVYRIGALCIYCMAVWVVTIATFTYVSFHNYQQGYIKVPKSLKKIGDYKLRHHFDILVVWYLILIALILNHFWYYFSTWF